MIAVAGTPNLGGPAVTARGLAFIGGSMDDSFRAFDVDTGQVLWNFHLPAGGQATPMTFQEKGRQYVIISREGTES